MKGLKMILRKLTNFLTIICAISFVTGTSFAELRDPMVIKKGQRAPFAGQLFSHNAAAKLQSKIQLERDGFKLKLDEQFKLCEEQIFTLKEKHQLNLEIKTLKLQLDLDLFEYRYTTMREEHSKQLKLFNKELDALANPPVYKTTTFWGITGTVIGAVVMFLVMK